MTLDEFRATLPGTDIYHWSRSVWTAADPAEMVVVRVERQLTNEQGIVYALAGRDGHGDAHGRWRDVNYVVCDFWHLNANAAWLQALEMTQRDVTNAADALAQARDAQATVFAHALLDVAPEYAATMLGPMLAAPAQTLPQRRLTLEQKGQHADQG